MCAHIHAPFNGHVDSIHGLAGFTIYVALFQQHVLTVNMHLLVTGSCLYQYISPVTSDVGLEALRGHF